MITLNWSGYKKLTSKNIEDLPTFAGVYKLATYNTRTEKCTPFYVGQADNVKGRTQQHVSSNESNTCIKNNVAKYSIYINYVPVAKTADRDAVEVALYNNYKPNCNNPDALPNVKPADISSFN